MGLLTEKYKAWAKYPENYTAQQVLNQIVSDLSWLDEQQANSIVAKKRKVGCRLHSMRKNCREYRNNKQYCKSCPHNNT